MGNAAIIVRPLVGVAGLLASTLGALICMGSALALIPLDMLLGNVVVLAVVALAELTARAGVRTRLMGLVVVPGLHRFDPGGELSARAMVADTRSRGGPSAPRHEPAAKPPGLSGRCRAAAVIATPACCDVQGEGSIDGRDGAARRREVKLS